MRVLLKIEYDGKNYLGWQKNGENNTVCLQMERAFYKATGKEIKIVASGRTDSGVHAYGQYAHCDLADDGPLTEKNVVKTVNALLPPDIRIILCKRVSDHFHARFNVKSKTYMYQCYTGQVSSPLRAERFAHIPCVLDIKKMKSACALFIGRHDFKAFCLSNGDSEGYEREILGIDILRKGDQLTFFVKGKGFLYSMVRIIVGTLIKVGQGKISEGDIIDALKTGNKSRVGEKMPAHALFLYDVEY